MNKSQEKYLLVIRGLAMGVVAFLWYLSIIWSADGFSINDPELHWIGIGLALSITVVQLVFNRGSANPTIFLVGLAAYIYGFATNFIGISKVIGLEFTSFNFLDNPFGFLVAGIGVVGLSVIVEAAPESFLLWALYPEEKSPGDFISSLFKGAKLPGRNGKPVVQPTAFKRSEQFHSVPVQNVERSKDERVLAYITRYMEQNNGKTPKFRDVVKNTPLTSTSQVGPYVERIQKQKS